MEDLGEEVIRTSGVLHGRLIEAYGLTTRFEPALPDPEPAREVAVATPALLEGAFLCRAGRSTQPMDAVRAAAVARVGELLDEP